MSQVHTDYIPTYRILHVLQPSPSDFQRICFLTYLVA